jgi:predicted transcriptional regulator
MSDIAIEKNIMLDICRTKDHNMICKIARALSVPDRVRILQCLLARNKNLSEIAEELGMPISSVARHVDVLTEAQLLFINYQPGIKGHTKYCAQNVLSFSVHLGTPAGDENTAKEFSVEMPVGIFSHCHIKAPCGMAGKDNNLVAFDDPAIFFSPERINAECIWFDLGFISYNFPTTPLMHHACSEISFSFEVCSETIYYNNNWPSDITVQINNVEVGTFTSPGDFGGRRGHFTPEYWPITSTQFGALRKVTVNRKGVFIDNVLIDSNITFDDLHLYDGNSVKFTIGIKDDAQHKGGINLFGKNFGDYPQSIIMTVK